MCANAGRCHVCCMNGKGVCNATSVHASITGNSITAWLHCTETNGDSETVELDSTDGALAMAASPLRLTQFGQAANATGFSPQSCRRIAAFLQAKRVVGDGDLTALAALASDLLRALGTLPEQ